MYFKSFSINILEKYHDDLLSILFGVKKTFQLLLYKYWLLKIKTDIKIYI